MRKLNWTVFISQTGKEVYDICNMCNIVPKLLVTNNPKKIKQEVLEFLKANECELRVIPFRPTLEHYLQEEILSSSIISLHGYLRILPGEFIQSLKPETIYNGHPGLITRYPELKGKDPQIRAWEGKYPTIGSVIHEVTEGVDEGRVVQIAEAQNIVGSLDGMYDLLRHLSLRTWYDFFREKLLDSRG